MDETQGPLLAESDPAAPRLREVGPVSMAIVDLNRSHRPLAAQLLREIGLFTGQEVLLMSLRHDGALTQASILRKSNIDASTLTKSLQRLEQAGLVSRLPASNDRRAMLVQLTTAGQEACTAIAGIWARLEALATSSLSDEERGTFLSLANRVAHNCWEAQGAS